MNALKLAAVGIAVCLVVADARSEDGDLAKKLVGKWEITKAAEGTPPAGTIVEFTKDGTVKVVGKKDDKEFTMEGKYKVETHGFMCTFKDGDKETTIAHKDVKITDNTMSFKTDGGAVVELKKKS